MKLINTIIFVFLLACGTLLAQIPDGGIMLNVESGTTYQKIGKGTLTEINVENQSFTKALRYEIGSDIVNTWDAQIKFPSIAGIEKDDVVLVAFYARTISSVQETGEGALNVILEHNVTYEKQISYKITIGSEWKQYYASVKSEVALAKTSVSYAFHCGFLSQTIEVADVRFLNYKNSLTVDDLPITEITYSGQDLDAAWRAPAAERIDQIRKGIVDITVYDEQGELAKDAQVSIEMVQHQFGFGTAIGGSTFDTDKIYREKVLELFNEVVFENDLKWSSYKTSNNTLLTRVLDTLDQHNVAVRGHVVIWPSFTYNPTTVKTISSDPVAFRLEIDKRIDLVTQFTNGRLVDWDVMNEAYTNTEFQSILGDDVMADWFKRVRQNDRGVKLYINDYSILSAGGMDVNHQNGYYDVINYIDSLGGRIEGIGMQGHFGTNLTPITKVYSILDRFAELGKEIKITEHDIDLTQRDVQADYTRDFLTIVFSHSSVKSVLVWGFWANKHWKPAAAFYNSDWSIRPHGEVWKEMIYNQWWTKKSDQATNDQGKVSFEGFLGTYKYTIVADEKERTGTFKINHSKQSGLENLVLLSLDKSIPDEVIITTDKPAVICEGEQITLQSPVGEGLNYKWYKGDEILPEATSSILVSDSGFYSVKVIKGNVEISSPTVEVIVNPIPEATITTNGELSFCEGEKVSLNCNSSIDLTYDWINGSEKVQGSVTSIDATESGSYLLVTNFYGCSATSEPVLITVSPCTTGFDQGQDLIQVYPNPSQGSVILETSNNLFTKVELYNALGALVHKQNLNQFSGKTIIPLSNPGFYTLKVSNENEVKTFKLICE